MLLQTILVIILLLNLRKQTKDKNGMEQWNRLIMAGIALSAGLFVLSTVWHQPGGLFVIMSYGLAAAVVYTVYTNPLFAVNRPLVNAFLPLIVLNFIEDLISLIHKPFYNSWSNYLEGAELLALVWMVAMLIINNKQKKALEKERKINEEKEKEYQITEQLKAQLEVQVQERTAQITRQKEELQKTLHELEATQSQLIHAEKMASLGELTAGIAHEIQNPLNFVNNFSEINAELLAEMKTAIEKGDYEEVKALANDVADNEQKINLHGKRADSIVKGMLQHSRTSTGQKELTDINALCDECLRLSYHGLRAKDKTFNAGFETKFDEDLPKINVLPQEIGRVILNLCNNAFYATNARKQTAGSDYKPIVSIETAALSDKSIEIKVKDNGAGIPQHIIEKIFQPFFTTKPTGQGTGLGLSMSYDIITNAHQGSLQVQSQENTGTTFIISLPYLNA
jgi:two-component system NtrC family sensor kinase